MRRESTRGLRDNDYARHAPERVKLTNTTAALTGMGKGDARKKG